ncbi:MAG: thiamine-phosphate kinase [Betaproteobacteria bacterium]|nr:thiamine-phosphate kinase [Betaproteobacteria bacterium]
MPSEFELIRHFFERPARSARLGVGDDCALIAPSPGMDLAVSTDMLAEGIHFLTGTDARRLGHKSLAVNISDLAAMGASPRWATLALAMPTADEAWLSEFSAGFFALADRSGVELIGGDTTRSSTSASIMICITIFGEVPPGDALLRSGAHPGDDIWVSGELGGAALGLAQRLGRVTLSNQDADYVTRRLELPDPRVELGLRLRGLATGAIDVSDGFAGDLMHILERSGAGAQVHYESLPRCAAFANLGDPELEQRCVLSGGDDYELIFTASATRRDDVERLARELKLPLACVGTMLEGERKLEFCDAAGRALPAAGGFDHFK